MVKYEPSTHSHLFYSVLLYIFFSYFIDVWISSHCMVAAHQRATEAVAGFSFGVCVGGGGRLPGALKYSPSQIENEVDLVHHFFSKRAGLIKKKKKIKTEKTLCQS